MTLLKDALRPSHMPEAAVAVCLGLISDTHYPERLDRLPDAVLDVFRGVDLILHAGDVGALSVLDELGKAAPVVAVHGNDERAAETQRELPYQQVLMVAGQRIVLCHTHHLDEAQEMESRKIDAWAPKLDRRAAFGHRADAGIVVYGHSHIPTDVLHQGVRLVNPGAIASGNFTARQSRKTVALLYLTHDGASEVVHVDLAQPDRPFEFTIDWSAGFRAAMFRFGSYILDDAALAAYTRVRDTARTLGPDVYAAMREAMRTACMPCWMGRGDILSAPDIVRAVESAPGVSAAARDTLLAAAASSD